MRYCIFFFLLYIVYLFEKQLHLIVYSNLDVAKNPEYNTQFNVDVDHKKKHSQAEVEIKYGKNPKDKTKRIFGSFSLNRKLATLKNAQLVLKMDAEAPEHVSNLSYST